MKVAKKIVQAKKALAKMLIAEHPEYHMFLINDMIEEKYGHKLNQGALSKLHGEMARARRKGKEAVAHAKRMVYTEPPAQAPEPRPTLQGPINLPSEVVAAAQLLLEAQRKHRVEQLSLHSNGSVQVRVLEGVDGSVYLGGRRAADPKATVSN